MKISDKITIVVIIIICLASIVIAQEKDPYKDENFLRTSDATTWDISKIPWGNSIIYSNPSMYKRRDIYSVQSAYGYREFFQNLPDEKYGALNYKFIQNFDLIQDHSKIDANKYLEDLGCAVCTFNRGTQNVKFSNKGITHPNGKDNPNGGFVSIPGTWPAGTLFIAEYDRIEIIIPERDLFLSVPNTDDVTIYRKGGEIDLGKNKLVTGALYTPDNLHFTGRLSYKDGQPYIKGLDSTIIDNVKIQASSSDKEVLIFTDGNEHPVQSNYVSLGDRSKSIHANSPESAIKFEFMMNNEFLKTDDNSDSVLMIISGTEMSLKNRDEQGLIPSMNFKVNNNNGYFGIVNGEVGTKIENQKVVGDIATRRYEYSSSPVTITAVDSSGNTLIGTKDEPKKLVISNYNELATIPLSAESGQANWMEIVGYAPAEVSERLYFNYEQFKEEDIKRAFPNIKFIITQNNAQLKKIADALSRLSPELVGSIDGITVDDAESFRRRYPRTGAWTSGSRIIRLKSDQLYEETIHHEAAHDLTFKKIQEFAKREAEQEYYWQKAKEELQETADKLYPELGVKIKKYGLKEFEYDSARKLDTDIENWRNYKYPDHEFLSAVESMRLQLIVNLEKDAEQREDFIALWKSTAGNIYGRDLGERDVGGNIEHGGELSSKWKDGTRIPRYGCVSAYGCNNFWEDIAEHIGKAKRRPEFFIPLIDPKSPIYSEIYKYRIDLLYNSGFIDEASYKIITSTKGTHQDNYYEVKMKDGRIYRYFYKDGISSISGE